MFRSKIDKLIIKQPKVRRLLTRAFYGDRNSTITLFGLNLTVNTLRENGYVRAAKKISGSSLLEDEVSVLITLPMVFGDVDTFVDIGANVGIFACIMARKKLFDPNFKVIAFEPHPDTFQRLKRNTEGSGVEIFNVGLGAEEGSVEFVDGAVSHVFTRSEAQSAYNISSERLMIRIERLDAFDFTGRKLFLKIDVEGQELDVLKGAASLFERQQIAGVYLDGFDDRRVCAFLTRYGFKFFDLRRIAPCSGDAFALLALRS